MTQQPRWKILFAFATVYLVWGSTYLGIRYAIETIPPLLMAGMRFLLAGSILVVWRGWQGTERPTWQHYRTAVILGISLILFGNGLVTIAEKWIPSGLAALLVASEPSWIVLFAWAMPGGSKPNGRQITGLVLGFCGVAMLFSPADFAQGGLNSTQVTGSLLVLGAALAWAGGSLFGLTAPMPKDKVFANGLTMVTGGLIQILSGLALGERVQLSQVSTTSGLAFLYLSLFGSLGAFSAYTYLMRVTTPAKASTYAFVNPVVAVLLGSGLAREPLPALAPIAMVATVTAVVLLTATQKPLESQKFTIEANEAGSRLAPPTSAPSKSG